MMRLAQDFLEESQALHALVSPLAADQLKEETAFKQWTITDVLRHLHVWNLAAGMALKADGSFDGYAAEVGAHMSTGASLPSFEREWLKELSGRELVAAWIKGAAAISHEFSQSDPSARVKWMGPDMSVQSSMTARLMETWAHGQEVYDHLGVERVNADRIRSIVILGNNTYGWTFKVRGEEAPDPRPHLVLTAPSGEVWRHNDPNEAECIEGVAEEFCQVVTQTRNIADTELRVTGPNATSWMAKAQCFAGAAHAPPAPGTRKKRAAATT